MTARNGRRADGEQERERPCRPFRASGFSCCCCHRASPHRRLGKCVPPAKEKCTLGKVPPQSAEPCMRGREMNGWPPRGSTDDRGREEGRTEASGARFPSRSTACVAKSSFVRNARGPGPMLPGSRASYKASAICGRSGNGLGIATVGDIGVGAKRTWPTPLDNMRRL